MNERSFINARPRRKPPGVKPGSGAQRQLILTVAGELFSRQGFHGTTMRQIADKAEISVGSAYNYFQTKDELFATILADHERLYLDPDQPMPRALADLTLPEGVEALGEAAGQTVKKFAQYIRLIYVDVVEFEGQHVARLYGDMRQRYEKILGPRVRALRKARKVGEVDPVVATMMMTSLYMFYFTVKHLFGVKRYFDMDDGEVIRAFADIFRTGISPR
jgi:AcrR family transcriptional regulator